MSDVVDLDSERRRRGCAGPSSELRAALRDFERALERLEMAMEAFVRSQESLDDMLVHLSPSERIVPPR